MEVMIVHVSELFSQADLDAAINAGHVKVQTHPELPLRILNYTDTCQWEGAWTPVTRTCRGLIVNDRDEVIARPFAKIHNYWEKHAPSIGADEQVIVTEKQDGSLGVLYPTPTGEAIATRGSFTSEQAEHATGLWRHRYGGRVTVPDGVTPLFEIIYPENRIVLRYEFDDLVLLAGVGIADGAYYGPGEMARMMGWPGRVTERFEFDSFAAALAAGPREDREGFVLTAPVSGAMVKTKYAEYVRLHRLVTLMTARRLWEFLAVKACEPFAVLGKKEHSYIDYAVRRLQLGPDRVQEIVDAPDDWEKALIERVPEEFESWVREHVAEINQAVDSDRRHLQELHRNSVAQFPGEDVSAGARGLFVQYVQQQYPDDWRLVMTQLDGQPIEAQVWKRNRPEAERPFVERNEDVA